jgi:cell division protein FtsL
MKISVQRYQATDRLKKSFSRRMVSSRVVLPFLVVIAIILFACFHVWQRVHVLNLGKEISRLEKEKVILNDLLKKSSSDIMELTRVSRIEEIAMGEMGMVRGGTDKMFTLEVKRAEVKKDDLDNVVSSLKKLADNLPVINESKAETAGVFEIDEN